MANISNSGNAGGDINQNISTSRIVHKHKGNNSVIISIGVVVIVCVIAAFYFMSGGVEKKIVGSWVAADEITQDVIGSKLTFTSEKECFMAQDNMQINATYSIINDNQVIINFEILGFGASVQCDVRFEGDKMIMTNFSGTSVSEEDSLATCTFEKEK